MPWRALSCRLAKWFLKFHRSVFIQTQTLKEFSVVTYAHRSWGFLMCLSNLKCNTERHNKQFLHANKISTFQIHDSFCSFLKCSTYSFAPFRSLLFVQPTFFYSVDSCSAISRQFAFSLPFCFSSPEKDPASLPSSGTGGTAKLLAVTEGIHRNDCTAFADGVRGKRLYAQCRCAMSWKCSQIAQVQPQSWHCRCYHPRLSRSRLWSNPTDKIKGKWWRCLLEKAL